MPGTRIMSHPKTRRPRACGGWGWIIVSLALAGCAEYRPTEADQIKSLGDAGNPTIYASLRIPERGPGVVARRPLDVQNYLRIVSLGIVASDDADALERMKSFLARKLQGTPAEPPKDGHARIACGAAVAPDGYIVTAAHAARMRHLFVLPSAYVGDAFTPVFGGPARVVFLDEAADFALLKCDFATPRFLRPPAATPCKGDFVFSGGWWHRSAAGGQVLKVSVLRTSCGHSYRRLRNTLPMIPEESGAPVVGQDGDLLGVITWSRFSGFWRRGPRSDAVMLDFPQLLRLIEEDRAKGR
jgi:hypothetical protein